jgi:hypothetical protein
MPKVKGSLIDKMKLIVRKDKNFCISDGKLMCNICSIIINFDHDHARNRVVEHQKSGKHLKKKSEDNGRQPSIINLIEEVSNKNRVKNGFSSDLTKALLAADIPLEKLNNQTFKNFLFKYTKENIPHPNTLRKSYIQHNYDEKISEIRQKIGDNEIYFIIDDTTE